MTSIMPDTSVLSDAILSSRITASGKKLGSILIHNASIADLESRGNLASGQLGLTEISRLRDLAKKYNFSLDIVGERPRFIEHAKSMVRHGALETQSTLIASDPLQIKAALAEGVNVEIVTSKSSIKKTVIDKYFDNSTMSVHLREGTNPCAKKGKPGQWIFEEVSGKKVTRTQLETISSSLVEQARHRADAFIEIEREGSTILQLGDYRVVITRPPFADGYEITAVRPVKKLNIEDYDMSEKLKSRLREAEGILISGAPGEGKSTFARALAERYAALGKIVKTVESPRDMILSQNITQYSISKGSASEVHDVLLLSRPDHAMFDEMRNTSDFELYTDLRLAGVGMAGVVHATAPIDAVHRFLSRAELGVIPHIIDTIIFIKFGAVSKVLSLKMSVKVPSGMQEADLARPVVEVLDFDTNSLEFEIYTYGEQTVVVPTNTTSSKPVHRLAEDTLIERMKHYVDNCQVEVTSDHRAIVYLPKNKIPQIIGKDGKTIEKIEKEIGISIDVRELESEKLQKNQVQVPFEYDVKKNVTLYLDKNNSNKTVDVCFGNELLAQVKSSKKGIIKFKKQSEVGKRVVKGIDTGKLRLLTD